MKLPSRSEVPVEMTWDLSLIYPDKDSMMTDSDRAHELTEEAETRFRGALNTRENIIDCLALQEEIKILLYRTGSYAELAASVDYYDGEVQNLYAFTRARSAEIHRRLSFIDSELLSQPSELLKEAAAASPRNRGYLNNLLRQQPHRMSNGAEAVVSALGPTIDAPYQIYNMTKLADMKFDSFEVNGTEYPLGYSLFEDNYEYECDTQVRRSAFHAFYSTLRRYENTNAAVYNAAVTTERTMGILRHFDNIFDSLLFSQKVTREMYDRQIDLIMTRLAPFMRRYVKLLGKKHHLDRMTYADLKIALDPEFDPPVTIEDCHRFVKEGLSILGEDYGAMIDRAFAERWIDFARNQGKSTGGFCASPYGCPSFILLSWNGRMADVFTIAHELGHAGHFGICNETQSYYDTDVSSYSVEAPSTMNEILMAHHLLKTNPDPRFRRWVLSSMIGHTYYHNFVTHLLEAAYQREVYRIIDQGGFVTAGDLNRLYYQTLKDFWGDAVELPQEAELTWMRQPHYYMGLYSYTYSAGLTLATQACKRIETIGAPAVEDWKKMLAAGSTEDPIGLAGLAGVDLTTDAALLDTINTIGAMIEEIITLTRELDDITIE